MQQRRLQQEAEVDTVLQQQPALAKEEKGKVTQTGLCNCHLSFDIANHHVSTQQSTAVLVHDSSAAMIVHIIY